MHLTVKAPRPAPIDLEERIEAFERAFADGGSAAIADFLPPIDHPSFRSLLGELIRVEIELLWERKTPRTVETYLARFPVLQTDPALLASVAFEEYRQRVQSGERVTPEEYRRHFGLDAADWPAVEVGEREDLRTNALDWEEIRGALAADPGRTASFSGTKEQESAKLPEPGDLVLRRFRIIDKLGKGAFGSVFLAERLDLFNRPVALKFLPGPSAEPAMLAEMIHENIVPIESVDRYGSMVVICMPFRGPTTLQHIVDGLPRSGISALSTGRLFLSTLRERSGSGSKLVHSDGPDSNASGVHPRSEKSGVHPEVKPLSQLEKLAGMTHIEATLRIVLGIANGLAHAHDHDIVHRDLKPANVLLADDGTPMILDFNLAVQMRKDRPLDCIKMGGTFPYMAPEQIQAAREKRECREPRSDLYSLGVLMFEMLTGQPPFPKGRRLSDNFLEQLLEHRRTIMPNARATNPAIPVGVADIIRKALAFDPSQRYQTARQFKEDIERELAHRPLRHARETSPRARLTKLRHRHPVLATAAAALLFLILPAALITGLKYRTYQRLREREAAEALVKFDDSLRACYEVQTLTHSRHRDGRLFEHALSKAENLVRGYEIDPAAPWAARADVARLDDAHRRQLFDGLGETFLVISQASAQTARDTENNQLAANAERWKKLAELFGKGEKKVHPAAPSNDSVALTDAQLAREFAPLSDAELYELANDHIADSRFRQALFELTELTRRNPNHFMAWFYRAHCLDNLANYADAVNSWITCLALQPEFAVCHYNLALTRYNCGQFSLAERSFGDAFRLDSDLINALAYRGLCRIKQKNFTTAETDLTEALQKKPNRIGYLLWRSEARQALGKTREAAEDEAAGMSGEPDDEWGYAARGHHRLQHDASTLLFRADHVAVEIRTAIDEFDKALAINPRNQQTLRNKAFALEQLNRTSDAVKVYDALLNYYPDLIQAHATSGVLLARLGRVDEAVAEAQLCEKAVTTSPFLTYQLGSLYAVLGGHDAKYKAKSVQLLNAALMNGLNRPELFRIDRDLAPLRGDAIFEQVAKLAEVMLTVRRQLTAR